MSEGVAWGDILRIEPAVVDHEAFVKVLLRNDTIGIVQNLCTRTVVFQRFADGVWKMSRRVDVAEENI